MKLKRSLVSSFLALLTFASGCDGAALCYDCKQCPALCPAGYVCKEATLIENGGAKSYHCGLPDKAALTVAPQMTMPSDPAPDAGCSDL